MSKVIYSVAVSIDGFIALADGSVDWLLPYPPDADFTGFLDTVGGLLMGRASLDLELEMHGKVYHDRRVAVMTHRLLERQPANVACFSGDPMKAVAWLKEAKGNIWLFGGGDLAGQMLQADAIDELHLAVVPVTLGQGLTLFGNAAFAPRDWELLEGRLSPSGSALFTLLVVPPGSSSTGASAQAAMTATNVKAETRPRSLREDPPEESND